MPDQTKLTRTDRPSIEGVESALVEGDLAKLTPDQRITYYERVCESVGLNPLTKPFAYIRLNGKLTLYAKRDAAEQLRKIHSISITKMETEQRGDIYIVRAYAQDKEGRTDVASGAVDLSRKKGEALANQYMKAETKAKRRVTLSMGGLGWLDETEVSDIPDEAVQTVSYAEAETPRDDGQQGDPSEPESEEAGEWQPSPKLQKRLRQIDERLSSADDVKEIADAITEHVAEWPARPKDAALRIVDKHLSLEPDEEPKEQEPEQEEYPPAEELFPVQKPGHQDPA